eukprot:g6737.t2
MDKRCRTCGRSAAYASKYGNVELLEVLVDRGARIEARTKRGWKPLHFAAQGGHLECVELLLRKNARATDITKDCLSTPLHVAADVGFVGGCRRLLEEAIDLEARDVMDRTPLHLAADKGNLEVVEALLEGGAKADVVDHDGWSPRQSAEFRGFMEIAAVLAKGYLNTKEGESATQGASAALPPAEWHTAIFAQVRLSAARQRKLEATAAAREETYAKYANIYKDHAAERYARAIEASRQEKGGLEAYRRRVVAASTDAERYRGYVETTEEAAAAEEEEEEEKGDEEKAGRQPGLLLLGDGGSIPSDVSVPSSDNGHGVGSSIGGAAGLALRESSSPLPDVPLPTNRDSAGGRAPATGAPNAVGTGRGSVADNGGELFGLGDGEVSEGSRAPASGGGGSVEDRHAPIAAAATRKGRGGDGGGGRASFADVVPFNNIRAKYLRPLDDTELSRPYHVEPRPGWRADNSSARSGSLGSSTDGSSAPLPGDVVAINIDTVASKRTMEAHRRTKLGPHVSAGGSRATSAAQTTKAAAAAAGAAGSRKQTHGAGGKARKGGDKSGGVAQPKPSVGVQHFDHAVDAPYRTTSAPPSEQAQFHYQQVAWRNQTQMQMNSNNIPGAGGGPPGPIPGVAGPGMAPKAAGGGGGGGPQPGQQSQGTQQQPRGMMPGGRPQGPGQAGAPFQGQQQQGQQQQPQQQQHSHAHNAQQRVQPQQQQQRGMMPQQAGGRMGQQPRGGIQQGQMHMNQMRGGPTAGGSPRRAGMAGSPQQMPMLRPGGAGPQGGQGPTAGGMPHQQQQQHPHQQQQQQQQQQAQALMYQRQMQMQQQYGHQQFGGQPGMMYNPQMGMYPQGFIPQQGMPMPQGMQGQLPGLVGVPPPSPAKAAAAAAAKKKEAEDAAAAAAEAAKTKAAAEEAQKQADLRMKKLEEDEARAKKEAESQKAAADAKAAAKKASEDAKAKADADAKAASLAKDADKRKAAITTKFVPLYSGPIEPLKKTANGWAPTKDDSLEAKTKKTIQSILNKMTREKFDKLADQMLDLPMDSLKMLRTMVQAVFDKALDEPTFVDMYADLCVRLNDRSTSWSFVKSIYNEDANQWTWTAEVGVEREVLGPFHSVMEGMAKAQEEGADLKPIPLPYEMELVEMKIKDKKFVKIMQGKEPSQVGQFYMVFMEEDVGRKEYQMPEQAFSSEEDALRAAAKKTNLRSQLLSFCQAEFEKEDIYEDLKRQEEKTDFSKMSKQEAEVLKAEFHDKRYVTKRRMLGNIQFIGELYKKSMLKENVMKTCVEHLLNATKELNSDRTLKGLKFISNDVDEDNLEALGKLIRTIGSTLDSPNNRTYMKELFRLMDKIANNKSINSRMRFMIRDLEELRKHSWVPRRKQDKAKTLDDIRKEAEAEARGGGAPPGRGGSSRGGDFRSGGGGPQDVRAARRAEQRGGGGSGPTDGFQQRGSDRRNHDSRQEPRFSQQGSGRDSRGGPSSSRGGRPEPQSSSRPGAGVVDRRGGRDDRRAGGPPAAASPPPVAAPAAVEQPSEKLVNKINGFVNEYISEKDKKEALLSFDELPKGPIPETVCDMIVRGVLEGKRAEVPARVELLRILAREKRFPQDALERALYPMIEYINDIALDAPNAKSDLGVCLAVLISEKALMFPFVCGACRDKVPASIPKIFTALLKEILSSAGSPSQAREILDSQKFTLPGLFPLKVDAVKYLEENKLWILQPGLWVSSVVEPKLEEMSKDRSGFLPFVQKVVPPDVLKDGAFVDQLTRCLLTTDGSAAPSAHTLQALDWACKEGSNSQGACVAGMYRFFITTPETPSEQALVTTFDMLLAKRIVPKPAFASWYQSYKAKHDGSRPQHLIMQDFFKKRVLT